jgi:poly-beta-1,6-N-acetyl-D-glucosamine synthase
MAVQTRKHSTVAIGIPVYNEEANIEKLLLSIEAQSQDTFSIETILIYDDGSSDNTLIKIKELVARNAWIKRRTKLLTSSRNRGKSHALQKISGLLKTDLVILIDSDMVLVDKKTIERLCGKMAEQPKCGLVTGWYRYSEVYNKGIGAMYRVLTFSLGVLREAGRYKPIYACSGAIMCINMKLFTQVEFPEGLTRIDAYIYLMCKKKGFAYISLPEVTVIDSKNISSLRMQWFIDVQNRSTKFPKLITQEFTEDAIKSELRLSFIEKIIIFTRVLISEPYNAPTYIYYKITAVLLNRNKKLSTYLWRN